MRVLPSAVLLSFVVAVIAVCVGAATGANTPSASASSSPRLPASVLELEKAGRLEEALVQLRGLGASADATHITHLEATLRALAASALYRQGKQWEAARQPLDAVRATLDPLHDIHLLVIVDRELRDVLLDRQRAGDVEAQALLARAKALADQKLYDPAIAAAKEVAERKPEDISPALSQAARLQRLEAEGARAKELAPGFWRGLGESTAKALQTIVQALILLGVAALVIGLVIVARRRRSIHEGTVLAVEDVSAAAAEREQRRRQLTREVAQALESRRGVSATRVDERDDLDASPVFNFRFAGDELAGIDALVQDTSPITIGPVSFNPRQVVAYLARRRSRYTLSGTLSTQGAVTVLTVLRLDASGKPITGQTWEAQATGDTARAQVIRDLSRQILFDLNPDPAKPDWRSFRDHRRALDCLLAEDSSAGREERLETALRYLQSAVRYDPSHWRARFDLATVLRKLGRNELAADHFRFIDDALEGRKGTRPERLQAFLDRHPDFGLVVRYNLAVALSKLGPSALRDARWLLDDVASDLTKGVPGLEAGAKARLDMLTRSAQAALMADEVAQHGESAHEEWRTKRQNDAVEQITAIVGDLAARPIEELGGDWNAVTSALAVAYNALGRAQTVIGRYEPAYLALRKALAQMPDFADPYLNLAELERRRKATRDWPRIVEEHLTHALELNPSSQRVHFLLGRLLASPAVGRGEEAKKHLVLAPSVPWASFELARVLANEGDLDGAIRAMRRSVSLDPTPDYRLEAFVTYLLQSVRRQLNRRLLVEARQAARHLQKNGSAESQRKKAADLLAQIDALQPEPPGRALDVED